MPEEDLPGGSFEGCVVEMTDDGHDEAAAERICGTLLEETKAEHGDVDQLKAAIDRGRGLIADVNVDLNSAVDVPAIDSQWVAMKSNTSEYDTQLNAEIVLKTDSKDADEKRISYAPAMIPRELDKEGDVVGTSAVENAAHEYLASEGGIDTDHNLIDGKGVPVESWIEPDTRTWDLPSGETKEYPAGTWMLGIKWEAEPWQRIKAGELTGLSIYGQAEKVQLGKSVTKEDFEDPCWDGYTMVGLKPNGDPRCVPDEDVPDAQKDFVVPYADETVVHVIYESETAARKAAEDLGLVDDDGVGTVHPHEFDGMETWMPGESHDEYVDAYMELATADGSENRNNVEASATDATAADKSAPRATQSGDSSNARGETDNTTERKSSKQDQHMTDNPTNGVDSPSVDTLKSEVDSLAETVTSLKDAIEADKQPGNASTALDDAVQILSDSEDIELAAPDIRDQLKELITTGKADEMDDDEMDDETEADGMDEDKAEHGDGDGDGEDEDEDEMDSYDEKSSADVNLGKSAGATAAAQSATQRAKTGESTGRSAADVLDRSNAVTRHNEDH